MAGESIRFTIQASIEEMPPGIFRMKIDGLMDSPFRAIRPLVNVSFRWEERFELVDHIMSLPLGTTRKQQESH